MLTGPDTSNSTVVVPGGSRANFLSALLTLGFWSAGAVAVLIAHSIDAAVTAGVLGLLAGLSPQVANQWERAVVLRMGRFSGLRGPGLFWRIPLVDNITAWVDQRVITTAFAAEETLTSDTVPVNVDAVLFWVVYDPEKAALEV